MEGRGGREGWRRETVIHTVLTILGGGEGVNSN